MPSTRKYKKRSQSNKKKQSTRKYRNRSRKQQGGVSQRRSLYNVYFNYILSNFQNEGGKNGEFLIRKINNFEHRTCWSYITETLATVIDDHAPQLIALGVAKLTQLEQPYSDKHFNLLVYTKDKTNEESLQLINDLMDELGGSGYIEFHTAESDDKNRYYSSYENNVIEFLGDLDVEMDDI